jgi:hypothetical protein
MTLTEILALFRTENPEIPDNVASDTLLKLWAKQADKEVCAFTRCIVSDTIINSVATTSVYNTKYNLTDLIPKFYDIDDFPGGGVSFDDVPLTKTTVSELDVEDESWRTGSAGTPEKYYRRGNYLYFDTPVLTADLEIRIYASLISDDFTGDDSTPYNSLEMYVPFHYAIVKYLGWKAKAKMGKPQEAQLAGQEYMSYLTLMKKEIGGDKFSSITMVPKGLRYHNPNIGR